MPHHNHRQDERDRGDGEEGEGGEESQVGHLRIKLYNNAQQEFEYLCYNTTSY